MSVDPVAPASDDAVTAGDRLRKEGRREEAVEAYLAAAASLEVPPASLCLKLARCYRALGDGARARQWAAAVVDAGDDFASWLSAASLARECRGGADVRPLRAARLALLGSYTTAQLARLLELAALRYGIDLHVHECGFGQYQQEIVDGGSGTYAFAPDVVALAVHAGDVALPDYSAAPAECVEAEVRRWTGLWESVARHSSARVIQHNFAVPAEVPMGHLAARLPGTRHRMLQALNQRLGDEAGAGVSLVDCDHLASLVGRRRWFDPRYWHHAKQAVSLEALPLLARHTAAVAAAALGLTRKCLVLDLDNTLWGGVIGEDGLTGIRLGSGDAEGEAFVAFQEYVLMLKRRGVILAVCSKNDEADAREPFERHPEMRIRLDDVATLVASWESKVEGLRSIARTLDVGLDSLVFVDDNPVERQAVRRFLPEVDVIPLPRDPALYVRALAGYPLFESASFTREDAERTAQYRARSQAAELLARAGSREDFYRGLRMEAVVEPFDELNLSRVGQLIGKSNQFNLTTRRHGPGALDAFRQDPECVHFALRLRDCFADHGLVSVMIAFRRGTTLDIDSWLMSCRVIGRSVEATMLEHLCGRARALGCTRLQGTYIPSGRNAMTADVFERFGFTLVAERQGTTTWSYDLSAGSITNPFIRVTGGAEAVRPPDTALPSGPALGVA